MAWEEAAADAEDDDERRPHNHLTPAELVGTGALAPTGIRSKSTRRVALAQVGDWTHFFQRVEAKWTGRGVQAESAPFGGGFQRELLQKHEDEDFYQGLSPYRERRGEATRPRQFHLLYKININEICLRIFPIIIILAILAAE